MIGGPIPKATAVRISLYLREAETLAAQKESTVSSEQLAAKLGLTAPQVRKDLTHFGQLGHPGVGYNCQELIDQLRHVLGTDQVRQVVVVGAGNLGRALAGYPGFERRGFKVAALFDSDMNKVGKRYGEQIIQDITKLYFVCQRDKIRLGILAVPASAAQDVAEQLVRAGIKGLLNFAAVALNVPSDVVVSSVALSMELEQLGLAVRLKEAEQQG
jgi:redox-sensing transcriptional repressor